MAISAPPKIIPKTIEYFKGLKISINNTQIDDENSPDMLNLLADDRGSLDKRPGKINLFTSIGTGTIKLLAVYRKSTGDIHLFAHGTKLYKITDLAAGTYSEIYNGLAGTRIRGFNYNDKYYFLDGTTYRQYDGTTASTVVGKIPTVAISSPPAGGGTLFEPLNYIQSGFKQQFSGNGTDTAYQLALTGLDVTAATATVDGVAKAETTDFTVNRTTGVVTFTVAPPGTTPDNVVITAYKTFTGNQNEIFNCTIPYVWGGADGSRVWLTGNPNYINRDYVCAVEDPTYWPVTGFDNIGNTDDPIKGYSQLYGKLLIVKRRAVYVRTSSYNADGEQVFLTERLNGDIGAEATDSIQILDTFPTFVTRKGVYQVISVDTQNERNVQLISDDINKNVNLISIQGLLEMGNLDDYVSIDYKNKYWLFNPNNGKVWVYDYRYIINGIGQWFLLDNLYSDCLLEIDSNLYMGDSRKGMLNKLLTPDSNDQYSDIEDSTTTAIHAYWTSKIDNYGVSTNLKLISKIFFDLKPSKKTSAKLYVRSDIKSTWRLIKEVSASIFAYSLLAYSSFTYGGSEFPRQTRTKVKEKKIGYYQIKLENNNKSESFGLLNISTKLLIQREAK
jgi:hypothetical protein